MGSAKEDVDTAASHVRGNRNGAEAARFGDNARFIFVELRIQDVVRNSVHQTFEKLIPLIFREPQPVCKLRDKCRICHLRNGDSDCLCHWLKLA